MSWDIFCVNFTYIDFYLIFSLDLLWNETILLDLFPILVMNIYFVYWDISFKKSWTMNALVGLIKPDSLLFKPKLIF